MGHNSTQGDMTLQVDSQSGVVIGAYTRDAEMPIVVSEGKDFARTKDGSSFSNETPGTMYRTQQDVIFTHASVTLGIHPAHHALQGAIWRAEGELKQ